MSRGTEKNRIMNDLFFCLFQTGPKEHILLLHMKAGKGHV